MTKLQHPKQSNQTKTRNNDWEKIITIQFDFILLRLRVFFIIPVISVIRDLLDWVRRVMERETRIKNM